MKIYFAHSAVLVFCMLLSACKSTGDKTEKQMTALRLYLEADRSDARGARTISFLREHPTPVLIQGESFLDERFVEKAAVINWKDSFYIQVKFDWHGTLMLDNVTGGNPGKRIVVETAFDKEQRWLAAPMINQRIASGTLSFTPDASREESERIVRGLNNLSKKTTKHKKFDQPPAQFNQ